MEMLVIGTIAVLAFVAVLIPLFRRGTTRTVDDEREFAVGAPAEQVPIEATVQPIGAGPATPIAPTAQPIPDEHGTRDDIEREVLRYREALRAGTLCARCGEANPSESAYCADCGKRLPLADAREFE